MVPPPPDTQSKSGDDRPEAHFSLRDVECEKCGEPVKDGGLLIYEEGRAICLTCAGLACLVFLPSGDAALTRRATKHSGVFAVVVKYSRRRKRHERQGVLVESAALDRAKVECQNDEDARSRARERAAARREVLDEEYLKRFAARLLEVYPNCPPEEAQSIARHACEKHSGRVGRSAAAKTLDDGAIRLAVRAHIRHLHTPYDHYLSNGMDRESARGLVRPRIDEVEAEWSGACK